MYRAAALRHVCFAVLIALLGNPVFTAAAQRPAARRLDPATVTLDTLLRTQGPEWVTGRSRHFVVHLERPADAPTVAQMLDSLEAAWRGAVALLDERVPDEPRTHVLVTRSRTRFAGMLPPWAKGLTMVHRSGTPIVFLVQNDSVRAHTRHEVMHLVSWRVWRTAGTSPPVWLSEGLAVFADGQCQGSTIRAVGRDLLAARPSIRAHDLLTRLNELWRADRAGTYVLAGTFVDYLWSSRGRDGVRRLWQRADSLSDVGVLPGTGGALTAEWRAHVGRTAGRQPGLDMAAFRRFGCG
jgi:hypothetical protein